MSSAAHNETPGNAAYRAMRRAVAQVEAQRRNG